jgi:hypothetical protein
MRTVKRRTRVRSRIKALPIQALYSVNQLARAAGVPHRRLQRLLKLEEVRVLHAGRFLLVALTEIEDKLPLLWESIKAAEALRERTR